MEQVLAWADAHHAATGRWPHTHDRPRDRSTPHHLGQDQRSPAIRYAWPAGAAHRCASYSTSTGVSSIQKAADLTVDQILAWADAIPRRPSMLAQKRLRRHTRQRRRDLGKDRPGPGKGLRGLPRQTSLQAVDRRAPIRDRPGGGPESSMRPDRHESARAGREDAGLGAGEFPEQAEAPSPSAAIVPATDDRRDPGLGRCPSRGHRELADGTDGPGGGCPF